MIIINEEDLTISGAGSPTDEIVYVPGASKKARTGSKITLFKSVYEFDKEYKLSDFTIEYTETEGEDEESTTVTKYEYEPTYMYVMELLNSGLQVLFDDVYQITNADRLTNVKTAVMTALTGTAAGTTTPRIAPAFEKLLDTWTFNPKYVTTGAYPLITGNSSEAGNPLTVNLTLVEMLAMVCTVRGDCQGLVSTDEFVRIDELQTSLGDQIESNKTSFVMNGTNQTGIGNLVYTFPTGRKEENTTPYIRVTGPAINYYPQLGQTLATLQNDSKTVIMSGAFAYLITLAEMVGTNQPDYLAVAGVTRGLVPHIHSITQDVTGAMAEAVVTKTNKTISINPIVMVNGRGYCIWGNRTLRQNDENGVSPLSFSNTRIMICNVKKVVRQACQDLKFETNNTELWLKFKSKVEPTLNDMIANGALTEFKLERLQTESRTSISVNIKLWCIYPVEDFIVNVGLTDTTAEEI